MQRRNFLQLATTTLASFTLPLGNASAAVEVPVPTPTFPSEALQRNKLVIVSGSSQQVVDAGFKALIEAVAAKGDRVSVLADKELSDRIFAPDNANGEVLFATDLVPWLDKTHHLQERAETRFWARLREEPDTIAVQHFADGCQFGKVRNPSEKYDFLAEAIMTGHSVITGIVAAEPETVAKLFTDAVTDYYYQEAVSDLFLVHNGTDRSQEFRKSILAAWA